MELATDQEVLAVVYRLADEASEQIGAGFDDDRDRQELLERAQERFDAIAELLLVGGRAATQVPARLRPWTVD